ncbi:sensor domain-containing diguanylate cyclase [Engelhardtia mirabilis]|uniref:Cyclic di-GMP phosphodiesterase Gmr n=1 Tax=Engelhardtia mirabilis TaxID=2528011 RepID=A0A518BSX2_9BACT|nr:Cyclic di-GMP phosphodiesterase Gmr [Planctomycetes bacterium Pla133]QDV04399.1 Cyclic di-GMP phosphodiesterase Gmr [Planctomycetes bacterium Pla86]
MNERWRAVVVESDPRGIEELRCVLDQPGAPPLDLVLATTAGEARVALDAAPCEVILLDLEFGAAADDASAAGCVDALALVAEFGARWPVVLLAREDHPELVDRTLRSGAQDLLLRGQFNGPALRRTIERARMRASLVRELDLVRRRYVLATEASHDVIWEWDIGTGEVICSAALKELLGIDPTELGGRLDSWIELVHPSEHTRFRDGLARLLEQPLERFRIECRMRDRERGYRMIRLQGRAVIDAHGRPERMVGSLRDVTYARAEVERLMHDAHHDALTGAVTRGVLLDRVRQAVERGRRRPGLRTAVMFIDLDRFKPLNDEHGHAAGDAALIEVVRRLRGCLRPADTVARMGGDEFGVLLEDLDGARDAEHVARRILASLRKPFQLDGLNLDLAASIGLVVVVGDGPDPDEVLRRADRAMYHAKAAGRAALAIWSSDLESDEELGEFELEPQRRPADQPRLVVRPVVELISRATVGAEIGACYGPDSPPRPLDPIGVEALLRLLGGAAPQAARARLIDLRVSASCLMTSTTAVTLEHVLDALSVGSNRVRLALPEDSLVLGGDELAAGVRRLRARGHAVLVDDFGERYAPLALLRRGGVDGARLAPRMLEAGGDEALLEVIVQHCLRNGFELVATGVDRERAAERLIAAGCALASGPHLGEPRPLGSDPWSWIRPAAVGRTES